MVLDNQQKGHDESKRKRIGNGFSTPRWHLRHWIRGYICVITDLFVRPHRVDVSFLNLKKKKD
jgi:hypothetical protein